MFLPEKFIWEFTYLIRYDQALLRNQGWFHGALFTKLSWENWPDSWLTVVPCFTGECGKSFPGRTRKLGIFWGTPEENSPKCINTTSRFRWWGLSLFSLLTSKRLVKIQSKIPYETFRKANVERPIQYIIILAQIRSVAQSCPTLCDPMNRSTPGLPVHHQLPEFTQTHVHRVSDAIQPSHSCSFILATPM